MSDGERRGDGKLELISFEIAGQEFCIDIRWVREIRGWTKATPMPHQPSYVLGVINLRGSIMPVL
ncbi:chemotaxis protein CheW [Phenylobacterium sp.]|uniref:chemotaxis protein CheW n=1 Tax=Phenylobacterium sp. TaxID=1871053 RepID=UPI00286C3949|nr:chemotaxis protein CheW [Phenylobacterium sp.]